MRRYRADPPAHDRAAGAARVEPAGSARPDPDPRAAREPVPAAPAHGTLFVVATPLGNLEDLTRRALRVLGDVDLIACEDTRRTRHLLSAHQITTPVTSFFEHNERWKGDRVLEALAAGRNVALVSDAGTPGISDPGYRLVREARARGLSVLPVPGACAAIAAVSVSGLPTDRFLFVGFLPARPSARRQALLELQDRRETLVLYESPQRLVAALGDMLELFGDREAFLCREATKRHEEYRRGRLSQVLDELRGRATVLGEIVLVVAGAEERAPAPATDALAVFHRLRAEGRSRRDAAKEAARLTGRTAREVYRLSLANTK